MKDVLTTNWFELRESMKSQTMPTAYGWQVNYHRLEGGGFERRLKLA